MELPELLPMRIDIGEKLAWAEYYPRLIDYAINITGNQTADGLGVVWALFPAAAFQIRFGVAPAPIANPGEAAGNAANLAQWANSTKRYEKQQQALASVRNKIIATVPVQHLKPMMVNKSLHSRNLEYIYTRLGTDLGTLAINDLGELTTELSVAYVQTKSIRVFVARKQEILQDLADVGQPMAPAFAVNVIKSCFPMIPFADCWKDYARERGAVAQQNPATLCAAIVKFVTETLPLTTNLDGSMSLAKQTAPALTLADVEQAISRLLLVHQESQNALAARVLHNTDYSSSKALSGAGAGAIGNNVTIADHLRPYCWTHGPCGHLGKNCLTRKDGHREEATWKRKMGGPAIFTKFRNGP